MEKKLFSILFFFILILQSSNLLAQEVDITPYLKEIEAGGSEKVIDLLPKLKKEFPFSTSVMFLDAVVTSDGQSAADKYTNLVKKYPKSKYADAALYRIYSYYFAIGNYNRSKSYLDQLEKNYPNSPYISIANRNIPSSDKNLLVKEPESKNEANSSNSLEAQSPNGNYTIQAGAFTILANANNLMKSLKTNGYNSRLEEKEIAGTVFHIVYTGEFSSRSEAEKALSTINSKFNLNGRVIETN